MAKFEKRSLALGIDAGGSYTDAVVMDIKNRTVLARAKTPTTHQDLIIGMARALEMLMLQRTFDNEEIHFVGLSTTLATNSILEGKGGRVGLITIGWEPDNKWSLGSDISISIRGGHDVNGRTEQGLDEKGLENAVRKMKDKVQSLVVSSKFSVLNPSHEERARALINKWCDLPVITGHELSSELGVKERTVTAVLNGRLLPIVNDFLNDVCFMLKRQHIDAKVMVLRGDGTMMNIETARAHPVETIMSGPAASALGGKFLSRNENCIVVDMGSTSTDIIYVRRGLPTVRKEGAVVGNRRTHVKAMDALTIGLGGDSHISREGNGRIVIGPRRVVPLCMAALSYPSLIERMRAKEDNLFLIPHSTHFEALDENADIILHFIRDNAPCSLKEVVDGNPQIITSKMAIEKLISYGNVIETGLTPTDLLHVKGQFLAGDRDASYYGLLYEASLANMTPQQFLDKTLHRIISELGVGILRKVILDDTGDDSSGKAMNAILRSAVGDGYMDLIDVRLSLNIPVVGLGGPSYLFLPPLEDRLGVKVIIPMDNDVGNAIGTICSKVSEYSSAIIRPLRSGGYEIDSAFSSAVRVQRLQEAIDKAKQMVNDDAIRRAAKAGGVNITVEIEVDTSNFNNSDGSAEVDRIEVKARALADPMGSML